MHKSTFLKRVVQKHQKPQITQKVYATVLKELLTSIRQELAAGRSVSFLGFGTFSTRMHRGGRGRNFKTGKPIECLGQCKWGPLDNLKRTHHLQKDNQKGTHPNTKLYSQADHTHCN